MHVEEGVVDPNVSLQVSGNPVLTGSEVELLVLASDNVAVASRTLTFAGQNIALDARGYARLTLNNISSTKPYGTRSRTAVRSRTDWKACSMWLLRRSRVVP